jgi:hypothetical protein
MTVKGAIRVFKKLWCPNGDTFKSDPLALFRLPIVALKFIGLWATNNSWIYTAYGVILHIISLEISVILQIGYLPSLNDLTEFTEVMGILPVFMGVNFQSYILIIFFSEIKTLMMLIQKCVNQYGFDEKFIREMVKVNKIFHFVVINFAISVSSSSISAVYFRRLYMKMWLPFDPNYYYYPTTAYQITHVIYVGTANTTLDMFPVFFMTYIIAMLQHLKKKIEKLADNPGDVRVELISVIKYHSKISRIARMTHLIYSSVFMIRGLFATVVLCTVAFSLITVPDATTLSKFSVYILLMLAQIFFPCYYGSRVISLSKEIQTSIFHLEWHTQNKEYRQLIKLFMQSTNNVIKMSSAGIFDVSLETFKKICESAFSLYAVFKRINR